MTLAIQTFWLFVATAFAFGVMVGGIGALAIAMRGVRHAERVR